MAASDNEDDELEDWQFEEENPPDKLQKKWDREEIIPPAPMVCPSCGKQVPGDSLTCLFCDAQVLKDSGFLGKILAWLKSLL